MTTHNPALEPALIPDAELLSDEQIADLTFSPPDVLITDDRADEYGEVKVKSSDETPPTPEQPEEVTDHLMEEMTNAYNYWHTHGYPEKAAVIWECIQQRRKPPYNLLPGHELGITPETTIDPSTVTIPPRYGRDATTDNWRKFALKVLDVDSAVIKTLTREDLIAILEDKGVIPREDGRKVGATAQTRRDTHGLKKINRSQKKPGK